MKTKRANILCWTIAFIAFAIAIYLSPLVNAQVTTRWDFCRVLRAGTDACGKTITGMGDIYASGTIYATASVFATDTITAVNNVVSSAGNIVATVGDVQAGDDVIAGDDVRISQGNNLVLNSATDTATISYNGTSINASLAVTVAGDITSTSGDVIAFDDFIVGDDVWIRPGGRINFDYPTGTEYFTWNGSEIYTPSPIDTDDDITTSGGLAGGGCVMTAVGELECYSNLLTTTGDISAATGTVSGRTLASTVATGVAPMAITSTTLVTNLNADLLDGNHAAAFATSSHTHTLQNVTDAGSTTTNAITAAGFETAGIATAAYFIGDGSLLTGIAAGGDFYKDGSVAMTGAYQSGILGTNGYDFNQTGYLSGSLYGRMFWDASKMAFRAGGNVGTEWQDSYVGYFSVGLGNTVKASAQGSIAMGEVIIASGQNSLAFGRATTAGPAADAYAFGKWLTASAASSFVFGRGVADDGASRLINADDNSMMFAINSTVPTLYIGAASGVGTYGQVGIATSAPLAGSMIDINGLLNAEDISVEDSISATGTIFATGTISSVAGYIANGETGIDFSQTICCAYDVDFTCTATGTVTFTKGILTGETCP